MRAISNENTVFAESLIENGAFILIKNRYNKTVFNIAIKKQNFHVVGILLNHGFVVTNIKDFLDTLKKEDQGNFNFTYRYNKFICLDILSNPLIKRLDSAQQKSIPAQVLCFSKS
jgi:ankyrin repeat protein